MSKRLLLLFFALVGFAVPVLRAENCASILAKLRDRTISPAASLFEARLCDASDRRSALRDRAASLRNGEISSAVYQLFREGGVKGARWAFEILIHLPRGHDFRLKGAAHFATLANTKGLATLIGSLARGKAHGDRELLRVVLDVTQYVEKDSKLSDELFKVAQRRSTDYRVRVAAYRALEGSRRKGLDRKLVSAFRRDDRSRASIAAALRGIVQPRAFQYLTEVVAKLRRVPFDLRLEMLELAAALKHPLGLGYLRDRAIYGKGLGERVLAVERLAQYSDSPQFLAHVQEIQRLQIEDRDVRLQMWMKLLEGISRSKNPKATTLLIQATEHKELRIRLAAADLLRQLPARQSIPIWARLLADSSPQVVTAAIWGLFSTGKTAALLAVLDKLPGLPKAGKTALADAFRVLGRMTGAKIEDDVDAWTDWRKKNTPLPDGFVKKRPRGKSEGTSRRTVVGARFFGHRVVSKHPLFVVDVSSSMSESLGLLTRIERLYVELRGVLGALGPNAEFSVIAFSGNVKALPGGPRRATPDAVAEALDFVRTLDVSGGTNYDAALQAVLATSQYDTVYFLSDGQPSTGRRRSSGDICEWFRKQNTSRQIIINTIGIGANDLVLRRLSLENHGVHKSLREH
ncbi:MAG: VWA domain-containing protein [Planctomycetota bacterium]